MKRFFCTRCKKMKRVRKYPRLISNPDALNPVERIGECNSHALLDEFRARTIQRRKVS